MMYNDQNKAQLKIKVAFNLPGRVKNITIKAQAMFRVLKKVFIKYGSPKVMYREFFEVLENRLSRPTNHVPLITSHERPTYRHLHVNVALRMHS